MTNTERRSHYTGITCRALDPKTGRVSLIRSDATLEETIAFAKWFSEKRGGGLIMFIDTKTASAVNGDVAMARFLAKRPTPRVGRRRNAS